MSCLARDARSHDHFCNSTISGPLFRLRNQSFAYPAAAKLARNDQAADFRIRFGLEVMNNANVNPADDGVFGTRDVHGMLLYICEFLDTRRHRFG